MIKFNKDEIEQWDNIENVDLFKKKYFQNCKKRKKKIFGNDNSVEFDQEPSSY